MSFGDFNTLGVTDLAGVTQTFGVATSRVAFSVDANGAQYSPGFLNKTSAPVNDASIDVAAPTTSRGMNM